MPMVNEIRNLVAGHKEDKRSMVNEFIFILKNLLHGNFKILYKFTSNPFTFKTNHTLGALIQTK